jgi:ligand-binding sensor domain-containing protein
MRLILAFFFLLIFLNARAQRYSFVEYSTEIGLPQSQVTSIIQDKDGYLWVGTLGGLAKFNGKDFVSYTREDGLASNKIISLNYLDETLWVGHEGAITKIQNGVFKSWFLPKNLKNFQVTQVFKFGNKTLISTNGAGLFELQDKTLLQIPFKAEGGLKIRDVQKFLNVYYIATKNGVYQTKDFKVFKSLPATADWSVSDLDVYDNRLCITSFQNGLHLYTPKTESYFQIELDIDYALTNTFSDNENKLWIATAEGMGIYDGAKMQFIDHVKGMPLVVLNRIFKDHDGNVWIGSAGKGLICFSGNQFVHHNVSTGLPSDLVIDVNQDKKGQFWISTYNNGLVLQKLNGDFVNIYDDIFTFWCSAMHVDGLNWFGTNDGLLAFSGEKLIHLYNENNEIFGNKITSLLKLSPTQMYVGGSRGLILYNKGKFTVIHDNEKQNIGTIRDMIKKDGVLMLATDKGLYSYKNNRMISVDDFSITTFCLKKDSYNNLYLGTEEGLYIYKNGKVVSRNFAKETASKFINFLDIGNGKLYIGTNNGLYTYYPTKDGQAKQINHFGIQEGVVDLETNLNSSFIDKSGKLWFGTASGLVIFNEKENLDKKEVPKLLIKNFFLNYKKTELSQIQASQPLLLPHSKNNVSFDFDGILFSNPQELKFQYWLEGAEETWTRPTFSATANYTGLRAGDYVLHARAVGPQENYSKQILIPFKVSPPYYQTWWFILLSILGLAFLIYSFIRFRIQREREKGIKEKMEIQNKLLTLEQQSLNASMNRHFIFNSLNSIQFFINTQDRESANKYLTNFAQLIRKNLDSSTTEGYLLPFSKELERLKLYLSLEAMRFKDRFEYVFEIDVPGAESILIPSMLLQPYIENAIVHGVLPQKDRKGQIKTKAWTENQVLYIKIEDNGIGISKSLKTKRNFDGDHRSQGVEITAKRISLIKQMSNQGFEIIGPEDIVDENHTINGTYVLLKIPYEDLDN